MSVYKFVAWVHPKQGGDDYPVEGKVIARTKEDAEKEIRNWLAWRSDVVDDFEIQDEGGD